jgi:hypothetical protein
MRRPFFVMLLAALGPCGALPQVDSLRGSLESARKQIRELRPDLSEQALDADQFAVVAARDKVYSLYAMRQLTPDEMSTALADRWREVRAGRFAIPPDWSIDGTVISRYGLCVEAALERISRDEFVLEAERLVAGDSLGAWVPPLDEHRDAFSGIARAQLDDARSRGLNAADAYSVVMAALGDLAFTPSKEISAEMWQTDGHIRNLRWAPDGDHSRNVKLMMRDDLRVVTRRYGLLTVDSAPPHATITVDGTDWGTAKKGGYVQLGTHAITLQVSGYMRLEVPFDVTTDPLKNIFRPKLTAEAGRGKQ